MYDRRVQVPVRTICDGTSNIFLEGGNLHVASNETLEPN